MRELENVFNELENMQGVQRATADRLLHEMEERKAEAEAAADLYNKSVLDESVPVASLAEYRVTADRAEALYKKAQAEYDQFTAMPGCIDAATYSKYFNKIRAHYQSAANVVYGRVKKSVHHLKNAAADLEQIHQRYFEAVKELNAIVASTHSTEGCKSVKADLGTLFMRARTEIEGEMFVRQQLHEFISKIADGLQTK